MATISDERLAELARASSLGPYDVDLCSALRELQSLRSEAVVANEPVAFVSPEQFEDHGDPSPDEEPFGGLYLPVRLSRAGNFTMPLYALPAPIEITEEMVERLAKFITEECYGYSWDGLRKDGRVTDRGFKTFRYDSFGGKAIQGTQNDLRDVARNAFAALELDKQPISGHIQRSDGEAK